MNSRVIRLAGLLAALWLSSASTAAAQDKLMHCFFFTPVAEATQADWDAFYKATDELPSKIPGLNNVWYGKLLRPLSAYRKRGDTYEQFVREHGVCMEFDDEKALKEVYAPHPAHKAWEDVYGKVRVPGTTTVDFMKK